MRSQRDSCGLVQPVPGSRNQELYPICTRETEWEARLTDLTDTPAREPCSGCAPQGVCGSLLVSFLQAVGTDSGCTETHGESQTQRPKPNQITTTLLRKTRDELLEKLVFSPVYILTGSQADVTQGTGTVLGPEITWRYEQLIETVSARGRVWLELRV